MNILCVLSTVFKLILIRSSEERTANFFTWNTLKNSLI